ncbi:MAG: L,D-transpeptidase [Hyphomicrobium sp.]|nr:L,D-transpeptidase [Hyphomicrobium sp.]
MFVFLGLSTAVASVLAGSAHAEAVKAEQTVSLPAQAAAAAPVASATENNTTDSKPHIAAAATPAAESAVPAAASAPEPQKASLPAAPAAPPPPTLTAKIDLGAQTMIVSENGDAKYSWPISSGTAEFPTPRGTFRPQWTAKMWYSRKYDNAPMPNAVFINGGVAVHATPHVSRLGNPASHGCIRLAPGNAKTFYSLVHKHGLKMTRVSVYGTPKWRAPAIASRKVPRPQRYAAQQQDEGWWFSSPKKYQPTSAYDQGFTKPRYRQPLRSGYYAAVPPPRVVYRRPNGQRVVYVQRPQRRVYYYSNNGYGYGSGW